MSAILGRGSTLVSLGLLLGSAACATVPTTPSALTEAQARYDTLETRHAEQRIEGDMIRARASIDTARAALTQGQAPVYVTGVSTIALRMVEIAEARWERALALQATDSLQKLHLAQELAASRAREAALEAQRAALRREADLANARADSLRLAAARADSARADSARRDSALRVSAVRDSARRDSTPGLSAPLQLPPADSSRRDPRLPVASADSAGRVHPGAAVDTAARHP